ncbi:MAG: thiamine phosphate synthase [Acidobacteriota bacterium]|nr:thiamine phosphate synthase [Acidobacteriota bacterium]
MHDLSKRRLYLCVGVRDDLSDFLPAVLAGGVDVVQLREKIRPDEDRLAAARVMLPICRDFNVPFVMNDSPELALASGADGVHVGQDDVSVARCRELLGESAVVGLSTHATAEFDAALDQAATYFSAGPIVPTPTKLGRAGTGVEYARECTARSDRPVFVTGGVTADNVGDLVRAGLRHFVVVRALTEAVDPARAARELRHALDGALAAL